MRHTDQPDRAIALWGGLECTIVRIGESYRDQIAETGHHHRPADLDAIAALGIRTLRYPVLWESIAPAQPHCSDWHWHDQRLARLRQLGIEPIAGLLHHGSGPRYTSLLDPDLPAMLAQHAAQVAARYPWIRRYTPVNEPLTTARFSGLYGHWYPHARDMGAFLRMLVNQCRAVALSMQAIRRVTPEAELVQTEDLGKTFSTPLLGYQADFENERRWLSFDLLSGRVDRSHPWYRTLLDHGIKARELGFFLDRPCVPDIIGINYYATSERYLDQRCELFPHYHHGGNARHRYADVEALRVELPPGITGAAARLREVWERYHLPLAVTEAHHGGTRDEQLRWLMEVWHAAHEIKAEGADLRAVTIWSLLGCRDWNTLLFERNGHYESGVLDVRSDPPRETALAAAARSLVVSGSFDHPVLDRGGRWRRGAGFYHPPRIVPDLASLASRSRRILIVGDGILGRAFARICDLRGLGHQLLPPAVLQHGDAAAMEAVLKNHRPWAVVHTSCPRMHEDDRVDEPRLQEAVLDAEALACACATLHIPHVMFSSDLVFDGRLGRPYVESDRVCPVGVYGVSQAEDERRVLQAYPQALVIRAGACFGPWDSGNFVDAVLRTLGEQRTFAASDDTVVSPTYLPDLVHGTLDILIDGAAGIWHLANQGRMSWYELAAHVAQEAGVSSRKLMRAENSRSRLTALSSERGLILPAFDGAIRRYLHERAVA